MAEDAENARYLSHESALLDFVLRIIFFCYAQDKFYRINRI